MVAAGRPNAAELSFVYPLLDRGKADLKLKRSVPQFHELVELARRCYGILCFLHSGEMVQTTPTSVNHGADQVHPLRPSCSLEAFRSE